MDENDYHSHSVKRHPLLMPIAVLLASCSGSESDSRTIVASVYPLAFAAEQIAGPGWEVIDLTPHGVEAHDLELTIEQRSQIQEAAVVLYPGDLGFQPQVEQAVEEAEGEVIESTLEGGMFLIDGDPHFWLDAIHLHQVAEALSVVLGELDPQREPDYLKNNGRLAEKLFELSDRYVEDLQQCRFDTAIVSHEAFAYLLRGNDDLQQFGLSGLTPEAEPTASRLAQARQLIDDGRAGAVFYEEHGDAKRIAHSFAGDADVPAFPLNTLESRPAKGNYVTVMEGNLESLREGLQCR